MVKIVTVSNRKGGVGKTTTAVHLAHGLAMKGLRTLLVDLDPQGHVAPALGLEPGPGVFDLLVGRVPLGTLTQAARRDLYVLAGNGRTATAQTVLEAERAGLGALAEMLPRGRKATVDYVVLDTAPSAGRLQEMALFAADLVLVPAAVDWLSLAGVQDLIYGLKDLRQEGWAGRLLGVLPTFHDDVTRESRTNLGALRASWGEWVLDPIHRATLLRECAAEGKTAWEKEPESRTAKEYSLLVWKVVDAEA